MTPGDLRQAATFGMAMRENDTVSSAAKTKRFSFLRNVGEPVVSPPARKKDERSEAVEVR